jgi:hypothetical protein
MEHQLRSPRARNTTGYYVEVIAQDGVRHHVGPFKRLSRAKDWIAKNAPPEEKLPRRKQRA